MTASHVQYALESGAWFLGGVVVSSIYWRLHYHRQLVKSGAVPKEAPLTTFVTFLVVAVTAMGFLYTEANRLELNNFVGCQARVNQNNVETINARSQSTIDQLKAEIDFYTSLLTPPPAKADPKRAAVDKINKQIAQDKARIREIRRSPLQPVSDCHNKPH